MIEGKPNSNHNSSFVDPGSHLAVDKEMIIEDEEHQEQEIFSSIYDNMVEKKSFPPHDDNFDHKEMDHCVRSIFRNHNWHIHFLNDERLDILAKEYSVF
jgi:hypothetical protein